METDILTALLVSSPSFHNEEPIPDKYTCDGKNVNPELELYELPKGTKSLAVIVEDPDAPNGTWTHWLMWNIPPQTIIKENSAPGVQGTNDFGNSCYEGPCPPKGFHRYYYKVYALNSMLGLKEGSGRNALLRAIKNHVISSGELMGIYSR